MIETDQLRIIPLNHEYLAKFIKSDNSLEAALNLNDSSEAMQEALREALENDILPNLRDSNKNYLYYTLWMAIDKNENKIVGNICLKGEPNDDGEVEIGYGVYEEFKNRGYMTEIVALMIEWLRKQSNVKLVTALTEKDNVPSIRVLDKNKFIQSGEKEDLLYWVFQLKR